MRQKQALNLVTLRGETGMTWQELAEQTQSGHGSASGALSNLHGKGWVVRLAEKREGAAVYVAPEFVGDRPTVPRRRNTAAASDSGWMQGYDAGRVAERQLADPSDLIREGEAKGAAKERARIRALVEEMLRAQERAPKPVQPHTNTCWLHHPGCALRAVRKAVI